MQPAVCSAWRGFNRSFRGLASSMYPDLKGFVTTGMGRVIDLPAAPPASRRSMGNLPCSKPDG